MISLVTQALQVEEIKTLAQWGLREVILEPQFLARRGTLSHETLLQCLQACASFQIKASIQWDILVDELYFSTVTKFVQQLPMEQIQSFRILDPGIALWFLEQGFPCDIHLICEVGNRNYTGLQEWTSLLAPRLTRLILSSEIPEKSLRAWLPQIPVSCELLGLGPILLFYTPRRLLSPHFTRTNEALDDEIHVIAHAEESQHRPFLTVESTHGTFIYNPKDLCILEYISELTIFGLHYLRIDRYDVSSLTVLEQIWHYFKQSSSTQFQKIRQFWGRPVIHGFYAGNRSDSTFDQLKNTIFEDRTEQLVGEVMDVKRNDYLIIQAYQEIRLGETYSFSSPDGYQKSFQIKSLQSSSGEPIVALNKGALGILPWMSHIHTRTLLLKQH